MRPSGRTSRSSGDAGAAGRPEFAAEARDRLAAAALFILFLGLYGTTALPGLGWYDTAEFQTTGTVLGVSHPPGYPLLNLINRVFCLILPGSPARCATLGSSLLAALAPSLVFALLRRRGLGWGASLLAGLALGLSPAFWDQANRAEAYGLDVFLCLSALLVPAIRGGILGGFALSGFFWSLALGHRPVALLLTPWVLPLGGWPRKPRLILAPLLAWLWGFLLAASVLLYLPLRSQPQTLRLYFGAETWAKWFWLVRAEGFWGRIRLDVASLLGGLLNVASTLFDSLDPVFLLLAWLGLLAMLRRRPWHGTAAFMALSAGILFGSAYKVQDLPAFLLPAILSLVLLAAFGLEAAALEFGPAWGRRAGIWAAGMLLLQAPLVYRSMDLSRDESARHYLLQSLPRLPLLSEIVQDMTAPDWARIAPLWYGVYVEKTRPDLRLRDDFQYSRLKEAPFPSAPTYVLREDRPLAGRFHLEPAGALFRLQPRAWMAPAPRSRDRYKPLDLSLYGNADYRHDFSYPNPTLGNDLYPGLSPGLLSWRGVPFRILPPYGESGVPPVLTLCYQVGVELEIPLESKATDEVWLLIDGRGIGNRSFPVGFVGVRLRGGILVGRELRSLEDVWDYENRRFGTPLPDASLAYGENGEESLTAHGISLPPGSIPEKLVLRSISEAQMALAPAGFTVFAVTQAFSAGPKAD